MPDVKPITLRLPIDTWERLRQQAHDERTTITALILKSIDYTHEWRDYAEEWRASV